MLTEVIPTVHKEWADATEAHFPESFLRTLMAAQSNQYGIETLKRMGVWPERADKFTWDEGDIVILEEGS